MRYIFEKSLGISLFLLVSYNSSAKADIILTKVQNNSDEDIVIGVPSPWNREFLEELFNRNLRPNIERKEKDFIANLLINFGDNFNTRLERIEPQKTTEFISLDPLRKHEDYFILPFSRHITVKTKSGTFFIFEDKENNKIVIRYYVYKPKKGVLDGFMPLPVEIARHRAKIIIDKNGLPEIELQ